MISPTYEFQECAAKGKDAENRVRAYLASLGFLVRKVGQDNGHWEEGAERVYDAPDLKVECHVSHAPSALAGKTLEVKADARAHDTGNVCLEIVSNVATGRMGSIHITKADFLAHLSTGDGLLLLVPMVALRERLSQGWHSGRPILTRNAAFTSWALLVPRAEVQAISLHSASIS